MQLTLSNRIYIKISSIQQILEKSKLLLFFNQQDKDSNLCSQQRPLLWHMPLQCSFEQRLWLRNLRRNYSRQGEAFAKTREYPQPIVILLFFGPSGHFSIKFCFLLISYVRLSSNFVSIEILCSPHLNPKRHISPLCDSSGSLHVVASSLYVFLSVFYSPLCTMMRKSFGMVILFKESCVFLLNAQMSCFKPWRIKLICFTLRLNITNNEF